jgi:hypothetical protein
VALFRRPFRGRTDVFPKYWENAKTKKKGYSPACANEWVRGACEKPRIKCGECSNQACIAVDDRRVLEHLQGHHVMGVTPMLEGDLCWSLAADFDKEGWKDDVLAFAETCDRLALPVALERSRSGNGAHAWLFFDERVAANAARRVGCFVLTETMTRRHQLKMGSYDRLFPNQDTMPKGGFGNLIAPPRRRGRARTGTRCSSIGDAIVIAGKVHRRVLRQSQMYVTSAGEVVVERTLYKDHGDEDGRCVSPMELTLGVIGDFWTPRAAQQALWVVTPMTPKKGAELFGRVGNMTPSKSSLDRLPKLIDERWEYGREEFERTLRDGLEIPEGSVSIVVCGPGA